MGRISRAVPMDQLRQPTTDVREHRPEDSVMSLAASMGDADVGQLQDVLVHPVDPREYGHPDVDLSTVEWVDSADDLEELWPIEDDADLHDLFAAGWPMRVVDGETRRLAAKKLGWATLDATIVPEPPEDTVVAQLDANTERIEMSEYETVRALYDHYEATDATLADMGEKTGYSDSYLSRVFGLMDAPDFLREAWRHPDHPLETSHALAVYSMLSANTVDEYAHAGGLDDDQAYEKVLEDAKLMVDVQGEHDLQVGEFRKRCKRCQKETLDQLKDQRTMDEKQADGQAAAAESRASGYEDNTPDPEPCMVCGDAADRKIALDVCQEDYGMLSEMKANDDVLMAQAGTTSSAPPAVEGDTQDDSDPAAVLADATGIDPAQAQQVIEEVQQQAAQTGQGATDD